MDQVYESNSEAAATPKIEYCDVLVIGTGVAGLYTALRIKKSYKVVVLTKTLVRENNSNLAQGGIAACLSEEDDFESHYQDTIRAGAYHNHQLHTRLMIYEAPENIMTLIKYGVNFDRDEKGRLLVTKEGGHSRRRILHAKDTTGNEIIRGLSEAIFKQDNIQVHQKFFAIDLITCEAGIGGVLAVNAQGEKYIYYCKAVVLATGGIGQLYKNTTNPEIATGDGIAMADRAGAELRDMEFVQFHPTALYTEELGQRFLISEAVRGEGAILRNHLGEAFMERYHELKDLAPRDIVSRSIFSEMQRTAKAFVYLDITHRSKAYICQRFPTIYEHCLSLGIEISKEWIPVAPAEHYIMGGIHTSKDGETGIRGLYACGECACTGVHGANRLASNSLLEALVFGQRTAKAIDVFLEDSKFSCYKYQYQENPWSMQEQVLHLEEMRHQLKSLMDRHVSIVRNDSGLKAALKEISGMENAFERYREESIPYYEMKNMLRVSRRIIEAAIKRKESLGGHYRIDRMEESNAKPING